MFAIDMDPKEYFINRLPQIEGLNLVKVSAYPGSDHLKFFEGLGTCERMELNSVEGIEQLEECYLVWYKSNSSKKSGWDVNDSLNFRFDDYVNKIINKEVSPPNELNNTFSSLTEGLKANIEILVVYDTSINTGLIVDGTKRALSLGLIKNINPVQLQKLFENKEFVINIYIFKSDYCSILFPCDFMKLKTT